MNPINQHKWMQGGLLIALSFFVFTENILAQGPPEKLNLQDETVVVVSPYEPQLAEAKKVGIKANSSDIPAFNDGNDQGAGGQNVNTYDVNPKMMTLELDAPELKALALRNNKNKAAQEDIYHFWTKAGFGNNLTPLLGLSGNSADHFKNGSIGFDANYISSTAPNAKSFVNADGKIFGNLNRKKVNLSSAIGYNFDRYYYYSANLYGFDYPSDDIKINYNEISAHIEANNQHQSSAPIEFSARLSAERLATNLNSDEFSVKPSAGIYRVWQSGLRLGGDVELQYTTHQDSISRDTSRYNNITLSAIPKMGFQSSWGHVQVGASVLVDNETVYPFPYLFAQFDIVPRYLSVYGSWEQKIQQNTLNSLRKENPFLHYQIGFDNTRTESRFLGFKVNAGSVLALDLKGIWQVSQNQPLFVGYIDNDVDDDKQFIPVYEENLESIGGSIEATLFLGKRNKITGAAKFLQYQTTSELEAWHLPQITTHLNYTVSPIDRLSLEANFFMYALRKGINPSNNSIKNMNPIFDVNASARFQISENFGFFLNANNLAFVKYQPYLYYDSYGINFVGGLTARF